MRELRFRRALASDAAVLASVAFAAKAHWGYGADFMERVRPALTPSTANISENTFYVAEKGGEIIGFYGFMQMDGRPWLCDLWLLPHHIGRGIGRALWHHLVATAEGLGLLPFEFESDPNAEGFYLHMGAVRIGETLSPETGRRLPLLRYPAPD